MTKSMPVFKGVLSHFHIFYCSGALAIMTHLSWCIIPPLSVNPPQHIQAIDLLCFALTGSHWQMCPWHRHMMSVLSVGCECAISLAHKAWFDDEFFIEPLSHLQNSSQEMSFIFWHQLSTCCLPPMFMTDNLALYREGHLPKHIRARSLFSTNWSTPITEFVSMQSNTSFLSTSPSVRHV